MQEKYFPTNQLSSIDNTQSFIPLAHGQRALWHLYQMAPKSTALNIYCTVEFCSEFNLTSWHRAWQKIGERHSILRTTYTTREGQPVQVVDPHREIELEVTDASNWSEDYLKTQILATADCPFDLEKGSVLRVQHYTRPDKTSVQVLVMHHIAGDMWSFDILLEELQLLYAKEMEVLAGDSAKGNEVINKLDPLTWQYTDYVSWQEKTLESAKGKQLWAYWKQELAGELPVLNLPTDRRRPPVRTYEGNSQFIKLDEALLEKLRELEKSKGASLYTLLLTAFLVQLYRYTNQEDILVGSEIAGRSGHQELKKIVGYFSGPVVLQAHLSGNPTFTEFLAQIRGTVFRALRHQDYPFPLLVEQLDANRDLSRPPVFQVAFTWQKHRWYETASNFSGKQGKDLSMKPYSSGLQRGSVLDLNLQIEEAGSSLVANWQYNIDLFDAATVSRMAEHFQTLLEAIVANPEQRVAQLPLLTEAERNQLLVDWNNTCTEYPQDKCIHQLFEEQVERTPDHVAVVFEDQKLTYRELNGKANQLAHYLQKLGVGPEVLVGICVERSLLMLIGLLGILKAGGAYVPLDPKYPKERLAFMLEDAQVSLLLTQQTLVETLPLHSAQVVYLDAEEFAAGEGVDNLTSKAKSTNLAYLLYTSGSTGKPKGVAIEHRSTVALLSWATAVFSREQLAGVLASTSFCFDISVFELFVPISCGGKVILAENALHLSSLPAAGEVTLVNTVFSAIAELVRAKGIPDGVRTVNLAGEALPQRVVDLLYQQETIQEVFNLYGPSEDTVYSTYALVRRDSQKAPPIGRPIANTQIYILDAYQQPVPIGVPGELHLGGAGLARGYLNRPELTQEKFIPHPFNNEPEARLYKTGDLVRYLPDGNIEFLGRIDHQVKVRGNRIELGEIESVLGQHPDVREVVVTAREDVPGDKRLFAYVVPNQKQATTPKELRRFLKDKLPDYMMPSAFVLLEALPRTPNGKVNRRALPVPDNVRPELEETFVAPRTPVEEVLAGIWAEVLGLDRVSVQDNFFELGGHSLLATQVISQVRDAFSVELSLYSLFEAPTISSLGEKIEAARRDGLGLQAPPILPRTQNENLPLSFTQQRLWFLDQLVPDAPIYNIPLAYRVTGQLNVGALEQSLGEIVRRHEALRTTFTAVDGQPIQAITSEIDLRLPVVDLGEIAETEREEEVQRLAKEEAQQPFDLTTGPLLRVKLLRLDEAEHVLLLTMHHIVSDGCSLGVLMRELAVLYEAFSTGKPASLPELPIQYADFAIWQREWLSGEVLESQLAYWKQQLGGELPVLELPTDRPRPPVQTYRGARQSFELSKELTDALKALSRQEGVTLFMTLLAAFKTLLYRYTGQEDIIVSSDIANRNWAEVEGLIGLFVNTLVLRTNLSGNPSFRELLGRIRTMSFEAYAHQDLPFEKLVEELQPERNLSINPLLQVMFSLEYLPKATWEFSSLSLLPTEVDNKTAKFDLLLNLLETSKSIKGVFEYNTDLFNESTITRIIEHFYLILNGIVNNLEINISKIPMLTQVELQQFFGNETIDDCQYSQGLCLHQLVEIQVKKQPDAVAIIFDNEQLTYKQLNYRANQLAHYLQRIGVKNNTPVGILLPLSLNISIGILGIIKAGGVLIPLETNYPKERIEFIIKDAQILFILTEEEISQKFDFQKTYKVCLQEAWKRIESESTENPVYPVQPEDLAYILYTSGSTGNPKGVMLTHLVCCNRELWEQRNYPMNPGDRILMKSSWSSKEFFWPLIAGATSVIVRPEGNQDISYLGSLILEKEITIVSIVPYVLSLLLEEESFVISKSLKYIFCVGEPLSIEIQKKYFTKNISAKLFNLYGLNEANYATIWECKPDYHSKIVPIGRATDFQIYLLSEYLQPVPIGVKGEIYISGVGLSNGYFNRPGLTSEKFITNPFSNNIESRIFKTGDLGRYLPDGNIQYLGRNDNQVQIRGNRVELEEVEIVLRQYPFVDECAVVAEESSGTKILVAYIVPPPLEQIPEYITLSSKFCNEQIFEWSQTFDNTYQQPNNLFDNTYQEPINSFDEESYVLNINGWNDSYTGKILPKEEMCEWRNFIVKKILSFNPSRILEIGCSCGILLFPIAPKCSYYLGIDFSKEALTFIEKQIRDLNLCLPQVELQQRTAENFDGIPTKYFDSVILNSCVEYFPNIDYLLNVLSKAIKSVALGGFILIIDVRHLDLLEAFHTSVAMSQTPESLSVTQMRRKISSKIKNDHKLAISPEFFLALKHHFPEISDVEIQVKRGRSQNELTKFRYDVLLHIGSTVSSQVKFQEINWQENKFTLGKFRQFVFDKLPDYILVKHVPNSRLFKEFWIIKKLTTLDNNSLINPQSILGGVTQEEGVDPEDFWCLANDLPYKINVTYSDPTSINCFDVIFQRIGAPIVRLEKIYNYQNSLRLCNEYANNPLQVRIFNQLKEKIRDYLNASIPSYMIPSRFEIIEALPKTFNGKINRLALLKDEHRQIDIENRIVSPRNFVEQQVADVWSQVLQIEQFSIFDNFFALGGHSLRATQVISRLRNTFRSELSLKDIYEAPTVSKLSSRVEMLCWAAKNQSDFINKTISDSLEARENIEF